MTTHTDLIARLRVIANAIADGNYSELTMRIPAEPDRDADIVVMRSALALESLEQQVAALTEELQKRDKCSYMGPMRDCPTHGIGPELSTAQAREAKLREALEKIADLHGAWGPFPEKKKEWSSMSIVTAREALALPADDSALQERLKEEREKCADAMWQAYLDGEESYSKLHDVIGSMT